MLKDFEPSTEKVTMAERYTAEQVFEFLKDNFDVSGGEKVILMEEGAIPIFLNPQLKPWAWWS